LSTAEIGTETANVFTFLNRFSTKQGVAISLDILLHDDGIGSDRHGCPGKDADGLTRGAVKLSIGSSGLFANDLKF
jgi:hypothetical protein